jgi:hypothetical protein
MKVESNEGTTKVPAQGPGSYRLLMSLRVTQVRSAGKHIMHNLMHFSLDEPTPFY